MSSQRTDFFAEAKRYLHEMPAFRSVNDLQLVTNLSWQIEIQNEELFVVIPCYVREPGLFQSLAAYAKSGVPDRSLLVVFLNASVQMAAEEYQDFRRFRLQEIAEVTEAYPELRLITLSHRFDDAAPISRIRGVINDAVLKSCADNRIADPIIVSNDADAIAYSTNYLRTIRDEFRSNPVLDFISGPINWSGCDDQGLVRYSPFEPLPEVYLNDLYGQAADEIYRETGPVYTTGCNSAFRGSALCAINGYDYAFGPLFDVEIGVVMNKFRGLQSRRHCAFLPDCRLITSPRRSIYAVLNHIPYGKQFDTVGDVLGSEIDLPSSISAYKTSSEFLQWNDLLNYTNSKPKINSRIQDTFVKFISGEPVKDKAAFAARLADRLSLKVESAQDGQISFNWDAGSFPHTFVEWGARNQRERP